MLDFRCCRHNISIAEAPAHLSLGLCIQKGMKWSQVVRPNVGVGSLCTAKAEVMDIGVLGCLSSQLYIVQIHFLELFSTACSLQSVPSLGLRSKAWLGLARLGSE